jgi:hypothetical protein
MNCPVCFDKLNDNNSIITCWNSHILCECCYVETIKHRKVENNLDSNYDVELNNKCPECREEMFDWFGIELEYKYEELKKKYKQSETERKQHYYWYNHYKKKYKEEEGKVVGLEQTIVKLRDEIQDLLDKRPKCSNCGKPGHNRRTCPGFTTYNDSDSDSD